MNDFIILDSNKNDLLLPTRAELVGVKSYFNDSRSAQEFGDNISSIRHLLDCKSTRVGIAIGEMSNSTSNSMIIRTEDKTLIDQIDSCEFEVISGQPSLAARSATLVQAEEFYKRFFGQEFSAAPINSDGVDFNKINSEAQFIGHLYADELSLRRKLGVYPGIFESLATAVRAINGRKSQMFLEKISQMPHKIVGLLAKTESGRQAQYFIDSYDKDALLEAIKTTGAVNLEDFGNIIASVYCDTIHEYRQRLIRGEIYKTVNLYYNKIDSLKQYVFISDRAAHEPPEQEIYFSKSGFEFENKEPIDKTSTSTEGKLTLKDKLDALDAFTRENHGAPVSAKVVEMFPELLIHAAGQSEASSIENSSSWVERVGGKPAADTRASTALPDAPPAIWKDDKLVGDTPPDFIKRHYGPWLSADATGLTRPDIKRLDPSLYMALANWLRKNELPNDCPVPVKSAKVDAQIRSYLTEGSPPDATHVSRIAQAIHRRTARETSK